jgi:hypothetical protein
MLPLKTWCAASCVLAISLALTACRKSPPAAPGEGSAPTAPAAAKAPKSEAPEAVRKLFGRWLRSDGGYTLEMRGADLSGALDAAYFNPKSIHVSRAIWMQGGPGLQLVIELNDVGYPGATYALTYDASSDRLVGQYTQPSLQQTFDIDFVRQATP